MSAVSLLTFGAQALEGTGSAVDVSAHSLLRLDLVVSANQAGAPDVTVWIETAPAETGPWTLLSEQRYVGHPPQTDPKLAWPPTGQRRLVVSPDAFCRVRWSGRLADASRVTDHQLAIGVAGDGVPDAA